MEAVITPDLILCTVLASTIVMDISLGNIGSYRIIARSMLCICE